jgi:predicted kinase
MLYVVIGPPAAGKSTWVLDRANPGDIVVDSDRLIAALTVSNENAIDRSSAVRAVVKAARLAAIKAATDYAGEVDVWAVHPRPSPVSLARYARLQAELVVIDPGRAVVEARCKARRPWQTGIAISAWYDAAALYRQYRNVSADEVGPGLGSSSRAW